jgi:glycosyltransferase involved in cell wall biosynthesis
MIKVCFLNLNVYSIFNPDSNAPIGGSEVQLFNIANFLADSCDFEVSVVTGDWGQQNIEIFNKIKVYKSVEMKDGLWNKLKAPWKIIKALNAASADIFIVSPAGAEVGILAFYCRIKNKKFILRTASSMECDYDFIKRKGLIGKIYNYGLKKADLVIAQSNYNKILLKENHKIDSVIVNNAFFLKENKNISEKKYILWVGKMERNKKPNIFLEIAKLMPERKFLMISPKRNFQQDFAEEMFKEARKIKNIEFIEKVPYNKIQKYFDEAIVFICTSDYEGFPNVHLQACIGSTPILTLNINPDNYINKNNIGYCANGNRDVLIKNLKNILDNSDELKTKAKNAYYYVYKNHNIKSIGNQWKNLICSIIS